MHKKYAYSRLMDCKSLNVPSVIVESEFECKDLNIHLS